MNIAHELAHTLGLGHCTGCTAGASVANSIPCGQRDADGNCTQADWNNNAYGRVVPSPCDNSTIRQGGQYNTSTVNPPCRDADGDGVSDCDGDCNDADPFVRECQPCVRETCESLWHWDWDNCMCMPGQYCPILIDPEGDGFRLTDGPGGVSFDLDADGAPERLSWTARGSDDAWLALDRDGDGRIGDGTELFGNHTPQPPSEVRHGYLALAEYDKPEQGGNGDGIIDARDAVFQSLRLWRDANHNGRSEADELLPLPELDVTAIELDYKEAGRRDRFGNQFRYRARVWDAGRSRVGRWAWDVFLTASR